MSTPPVSVIIPTHNSARFIYHTLQSVMAQTFLDFEIIVVDDASTDNTCEIVKSFRPEVRLIERKRNSGTADIPRYDGVEAAKGDYCAFLDADDLWMPEKLQAQVPFLNEHKDVSLVHSYVMVMDENGHDLYVRHEGSIPPTGMIARELLRHCFISTSSVVVKREAWLRAQRRQDITGYGTEWDFFLAIAREYPIGFIPEVLVKYRHHQAGISRRNWRRTPRDVVAFRRIWRKGLWKNLVTASEYGQLVAEACQENAQFWRDRGYPFRAIWFAGIGLGFDCHNLGLWYQLLASGARMIIKRPRTVGRHTFSWT